MTRTLILGLTLLTASACASEQTSSDTLSISMCSGATTGDSYNLGQLVIDHDDLLIHVQTGGGCASHSFAICWDGGVIDTEPPMVDLTLRHDAHGDTCDAVLSRELRVDLVPVIAKVAPPLVLNVTGASAQLAGTTSSVRLGD